MDSSEENKQQSTDLESANRNNKEQSPANVEFAESKDSTDADEASTMIDALKLSRQTQR